MLIQIPAPVYPDMARQAEVEGTVMVRALVGKDGKVQDAFVTDGRADAERRGDRGCDEGGLQAGAAAAQTGCRLGADPDALQSQLTAAWPLDRQSTASGPGSRGSGRRFSFRDAVVGGIRSLLAPPNQEG